MAGDQSQIIWSHIEIVGSWTSAAAARGFHLLFFAFVMLSCHTQICWKICSCWLQGCVAQVAGKTKAAKRKPEDDSAVLQPSNAVNKPSQASSKGSQAIEDIYQKKTQLEHILLRPDTYIGSTEKQQQKLWIYDGQSLKLADIDYVPGLYKIFDEILVNAADNKVRDPSMNMLKVDINKVRFVRGPILTPSVQSVTLSDIRDHKQHYHRTVKTLSYCCTAVTW